MAAGREHLVPGNRVRCLGDFAWTVQQAELDADGTTAWLMLTYQHDNGRLLRLPNIHEKDVAPWLDTDR